MSKKEAAAKFGEIASKTGVEATAVAAIADGKTGIRGVQPHKLRAVQEALFAQRQAAGARPANAMR